MGKLEQRGAYLSQAGDEEMSAIKGGRHLLQEVESLRKVPKTKSVNKRDRVWVNQTRQYRSSI